jgi:hypothetical protein
VSSGAEGISYTEFYDFGDGLRKAAHEDSEAKYGLIWTDVAFWVGAGKPSGNY